MCDIIQKLSVETAISYGGVAQLGERTVRIRKVKGSNPSVSTKKEDTRKGCLPFWFSMDDRIIIAHAGGMCMNQCAHW